MEKCFASCQEQKQAPNLFSEIWKYFAYAWYFCVSQILQWKGVISPPVRKKKKKSSVLVQPFHLTDEELRSRQAKRPPPGPCQVLCRTGTGCTLSDFQRCVLCLQTIYEGQQGWHGGAGRPGWPWPSGLGQSSLSHIERLLEAGLKFIRPSLSWTGGRWIPLGLSFLRQATHCWELAASWDVALPKAKQSPEIPVGRPEVGLWHELLKGWLQPELSELLV